MLKFYLLRSKICKLAFPLSHIIDFFSFLHCFDHFIFIYSGIVITARLQIQHLKDFQVPDQTRNCHWSQSTKTSAVGSPLYSCLRHWVVVIYYCLTIWSAWTSWTHAMQKRYVLVKLYCWECFKYVKYSLVCLFINVRALM